MSTKTRLQALLGSYADASGDLDLRVFIGTPGSRIEVRNETVDTGQGYLIPGFLDGLLQVVGAIVDAVQEENLEVTNPLGQTSYTLAKTPINDANLLVFKNGALLRRGTGYTRSGKDISLTGAFGDWFCFSYRHSDN